MLNAHMVYVEEQNPTQVVIWFQIADGTKREDMLTYLKGNPKYLWGCFQRVSDGFTVQPERNLEYFAH